MIKSNRYDIVIVGAGPAGLYTAYSAIKKNPNLSILIIEKGKELNKRECPAKKNGIKCINCSVCSIMSGCAGAGAFSDGKFPITNNFGGVLWEKIGREKSLELQKEVDNINRELYYETKGCSGRADPKIGWIEYNKPEEAFPKLYSSKSSTYKKICTQHNLHLLDADIRHLGTDIGQVIYGQLCETLKEAKVEFLTRTEVTSIMTCPDPVIKKDYNYCVGTKTNVFYAKSVVVATGRSGSSAIKNFCKNLNISTISNKVDLGIRFECPDEIWSHITKDLYESKIVYRTKTYEDEVRTFCMNPSGEVVTENTNGYITVNGHAFEDPSKKTKNTNFALLVSQSFSDPFNDSNEYGDAIVRLSNMLGGGVIVQRYGDLIRGKRSTKDHILHNTVQPTLNAEPGDLSLVLPKRLLDDIIEMIQKLDHLVPGMTNDDNLLYGVEVKRYNVSVALNNNLEADGHKNLFFIGDGAGLTRSLSQASASGLYVGNYIAENL